ncbi:hypothetical protein A6A25_34240 [Saccharothrix sp. CB00851]|nr:hypothetical protein A6A25_34240 [Saccharothrix sp. CB00851]
MLPASLLLAKAFCRAAQSLRTNNQLRLAAIHGMRELAIHRRRDDDPDATAAALHDLAETYRAQGVLHKVVGCADEMLETYLLAHHEAGIASTLTHLGALMIEAHRPGAAVKYLNRADQAYGQLHDTGAHAECPTLLGRALWLSGDRAIAHRRFNRALALLIGTDDVAAQRVRDLVAQLESAQPEPEAVPEQPDQDGDDSDLHVWLVGRRHHLRPPDIQPDQRHRPEERP